jgi:pyruvate/2-oxoglutarate dehydrogenase complex dihydrolipoamide acyltransferase (E2) component
MPEYKLPDVGEGLTEAEIVTWKVKVGDVIAINDIVVEIETAKSLVELPSPYAGTVTGLLVPEGETVAVGTPIIAIAAEGEAPAPAAPAAPAAAPQADLGEIDLSNPRASGGGEGESLVGRNKAERDSLRRPRKGTSPAAAAAQHSTHEQIRGVVRPRRAGLAGGRRGRRAGRPGVHTRGPDCPVRERRRRAHAGQASGPQAGQGSRRRHHLAHRYRRRWGGHPRGRPGRFRRDVIRTERSRPRFV